MVQTSADANRLQVPRTCLPILSMTSVPGLGEPPSENGLSADNPPCKLLLKVSPSLEQHEPHGNFDEEELAIGSWSVCSSSTLRGGVCRSRLCLLGTEVVGV